MNKIILLSFILSAAAFSMESEEEFTSPDLIMDQIYEYAKKEAKLINERNDLLLSVYNVIPTMTSGEICKDLSRLKPQMVNNFLYIEQRLDDINMYTYYLRNLLPKNLLSCNDKNN